MEHHFRSRTNLLLKLVLFNLFLLALSISWFLGIFFIYGQTQKIIDRTLVQPLPFSDPVNPPIAFRKSYLLHSCLKFIAVLVAPFLLAFILINVQNAMLWTKNSLVLDTAGNAILFLMWCWFIPVGLYTLIYQKFMARFPDHEMFHNFKDLPKKNKLWRLDELMMRMRQAHKDNANRLRLFWLISGIPLILTFDNYVNYTTDGVKFNSYWGIGEKMYGWKDLQSAELHGKVSRGKNLTSLFLQLSTQTTSNQPIDINEEAPLFGSASLGQASESSIYRLAQALRKHGVPVRVRTLSRGEERILTLSGESFQLWAHQLISGISALPGVQVVPSNE